MFLTPRWIASHLFAAGLIVAFVFAGFWQIDRLGARQDTNDLVRERASAEPVELAAIDGPADDVEYRSITMTGEYDPDRQILVANRVDEGAPGFWAWTVFRADDEAEVIVNRGFVGRATVLDESAFAQTTAITGPVEIAGLIRKGLDSGRSSSDRSEISRPNATLAGEILDVQNHLDASLYVQLTAQDRRQPGELPVPLPPLDLGEGPHRSYAFQWFTFATIGTVGYALVLLRINRGSPALGDVASD